MRLVTAVFVAVACFVACGARPLEPRGLCDDWFGDAGLAACGGCWENIGGCDADSGAGICYQIACNVKQPPPHD